MLEKEREGRKVKANIRNIKNEHLFTRKINGENIFSMENRMWNRKSLEMDLEKLERSHQKF
jgi:hypothetical protein